VLTSSLAQRRSAGKETSLFVFVVGIIHGKEATAGVVVFSAKGRVSNDTQIILVCDEGKHINALRNMRGLMIT
jgi:hypothetical protein